MSIAKRLAGFAACALLAAAFVPAAAMAEGEVVTVDAADDFAALAQRVAAGDSMEGVTVKLEQDIDFSKEGWFNPIGDAEHPFKGSFDGQGHELSNMTVYKAVVGVGRTYLGMFGVADGATFENIVIRDMNVSIYTTSVAFEALLCPVMTDCTVTGCDIQGVVGAESGSSLTMGGMCANATSCTIEDTTVNYSRGVQATDQFSPSYPSAVIARTATDTEIRDCNVSGTVSGSGSVNSGAVVATATGCTVEGCESDVSIIASVSSGGYCGGIVGQASRCEIRDCVNRGAITCTGSNNSGCVAGVVGCLTASTLERCANEADVSMTVSVSTYDGGQTGSEYASGLVGTASGGSTVSGCLNSGFVFAQVTAVRHAYSRAAGLVGDASLTDIANCYNCGNVKAEAQTTSAQFPDSHCVAGGIGANLDEYVTVKNCYNVGSVSHEYLTKSSNAPLVDGICPTDAAEITSCYSYRCSALGTTPASASLTAVDMMNAQTYSGWDFESDWRMDEGEYLLPILQWESAPHGTVLKPETVLDDVRIAPIPSMVYTGKVRVPKLAVTGSGKALTLGTDYRVSYKNNVNAGTATVEVDGWGAYIGAAKATFKIEKAANTLTAKAKKATFKRNKKKALKTSIVVSKAQGKVTYKSSKKKVKVSAKGAVTIKKGFKGTAKITVKAAGDKNYKAVTKILTIKVK